MARTAVKIGDVFAVVVDEHSERYFQYVAKDMTQLGSDVIRAFAREYPADEHPDIPNIVADKVAFYAHCVVAWGLKLGLWEKRGHISDVGSLDVLFRTSCDWPPKPGVEVTVSHSWRVWRMGEPFQYVGELEGANRDAEIGVVYSAYDIVDRLRTGHLVGFYPPYEESKERGS